MSKRLKSTIMCSVAFDIIAEKTCEQRINSYPPRDSTRLDVIFIMGLDSIWYGTVDLPLLTCMVHPSKQSVACATHMSGTSDTLPARGG